MSASRTRSAVSWVASAGSLLLLVASALGACEADGGALGADTGGGAGGAACEPGSNAAEGATETCLPCAIGSAQPAPAKTACELCAPGSFAADEGMTGCDPCPEDT